MRVSLSCNTSKICQERGRLARSVDFTNENFSVYLLGREQPVEVRADWFALVGTEGEQSYRFKVKTSEGSEVIDEMPARNLLLVVEKESLA